MRKRATCSTSQCGRCTRTIRWSTSKRGRREISMSGREAAAAESGPITENPDALEVAPGFQHNELQGWIPKLASEEETRQALEKAFDYRGDVTLTLKDGSKVEGYLFDRRSNGATLDACTAWLFPKDRDEKVSVPYSQIARLEFSGKDTAHGKS